MILSEDQILFIGGLLLSILLSWGFRFIPNYQFRLAYSLILGFSLQFAVYGFDIWIPLLFHIMVYILILLWGRNCGAVVTITTMTILSMYHIYRMIIDYGSWTLDISTILMAMICKYSMLAYSYQNGDKKVQEIGEEHFMHRVERLPNFIDYLGYCLFLPTAVLGTTIEYTDYDNFMHLKSPFNVIDAKLQLKWILWDAGYSFICVSIYLVGHIFYPLNYMKTHQFIEDGRLYIMYYSFFSVSFLRYKYYFGWKLSECSLHACGISYEGEDKFRRIRTCDPYTVEVNPNFKLKLQYWNMSCQLWLRRCIYENLFKGKSYGQLATFMISAFWHGFYAGYYFSFFLWFLQIHLNRLIFRYWKTSNSWIIQLTEISLIWRMISWIFWLSIFTINGLYFQILQAKLCLKVLKEIYAIPPLIILVLISYFTLNAPKKMKKVSKND